VTVRVIKVWHDDIRPAPPGWEWARTNEVALKLLRENTVTEISMDHDLGLDHLDPFGDPELIFFAGPSNNGTGLDLVEIMCKENLVPPKVTIHSWNPPGAQAMAARFNHFGFDCDVSPYQVPQ